FSFFFSSRRRHTRSYGDWSSDVCSSDLGRDFPWASWSSDGRQLACLKPKGIQIIDVASRQVVRTLARQGIVQQLVWSPDGKAFIGTANGLGPYWNIGRLVDGADKINAVS